jgi:hypothetical protein
MTFSIIDIVRGQGGIHLVDHPIVVCFGVALFRLLGKKGNGCLAASCLCLGQSYVRGFKIEAFDALTLLGQKICGSLFTCVEQIFFSPNPSTIKIII